VDDLFATHDALAVADLIRTRLPTAPRSPGCAAPAW